MDNFFPSISPKIAILLLDFTEIKSLEQYTNVDSSYNRKDPNMKYCKCGGLLTLRKVLFYPAVDNSKSCVKFSAIFYCNDCIMDNYYHQKRIILAISE